MRESWGFCTIWGLWRNDKSSHKRENEEWEIADSEGNIA